MTRRVSIALVLIGATLMSFVGLILRNIEAADGFQIMAYRSLSLSVIVLAFACWHRRETVSVFLGQIDLKDALVGLFLGGAFTLYVFALLTTNIASALFILACSPVFAAILSWMLLKEPPTPATLVAILLALIGVTLMVSDGISDGRLLGNLCAVASSFCFAVMLVLIRKYDRDPLGGTFLAGVFSSIGNAVFALLIGSGLFISAWDLGLSLFMGAFTIGLGIACVTAAARHLPASEVSILVLLESVLGPIWVWLFLNEDTTAIVLIGGAIVFGAVVLQTLAASKRRTA